MNEAISIGPFTSLDALTPSQKNTANITFYLQKIELPGVIADKLCGKDEGKRSRYASGIGDLLENKNDSSFSQRFRQQWGDEAELLEQSLSRHLDNLTHQIHAKAPTYHALDSLKVLYKAGKNIGKLSKGEISDLLEVSGYNKEEATQITGKIAISTALTALEVPVFATGVYAAMGYAALHPFLESSLDTQTATVLGLSFVAKCATIVVNSVQTSRLLRDPNIATSPNVISTGLFYLAKKAIPHKDLVHDIVASGVPSIISFVQDYAMSGLVLAGQISPSILAARLVADAGLNVVEAAAKEGWIFSKNRQNSQSNDPSNPDS